MLELGPTRKVVEVGQGELLIVIHFSVTAKKMRENTYITGNILLLG